MFRISFMQTFSKRYNMRNFLLSFIVGDGMKVLVVCKVWIFQSAFSNKLFFFCKTVNFFTALYITLLISLFMMPFLRTPYFPKRNPGCTNA